MTEVEQLRRERDQARADAAMFRALYNKTSALLCECRKDLSSIKSDAQFMCNGG